VHAFTSNPHQLSHEDSISRPGIHTDDTLRDAGYSGGPANENLTVSDNRSRLKMLLPDPSAQVKIDGANTASTGATR
jgi:hypothetical protein